MAGRLFGHWGYSYLALFSVLLVLAVLTGYLSVNTLALYIAISGVTYGVYATDKAAARYGNPRTSEKALHTLSLAGGWPGAMIAQQRLRHKSSKQRFRIAFWFTVALNSALVAAIALALPRGYELSLTRLFG